MKRRKWRSISAKGGHWWGRGRKVGGPREAEY